MELQEAIRTRRTVHAYTAEPLPDGALEEALAAAHMAPNHHLTIPWRFTLPGPETRARLVPIAIAVKDAKRRLGDEAREKLRAKLLNPAAQIVVSQILHEDPATREEDYAAIACAIQNLMLSLSARGVGSKWTTGSVTHHPDTYALLGIDPGRERIVGWVWAGHPAKVPTIKRPPPDEVIRRLP